MTSEPIKEPIKKKKRKRRRWPLVLVFLLGLAILSYPLFSRWYYEQEASSQVADFQQGLSLIGQEEIQERLHLAYAFNESLISSSLDDPYGKDHAAGRAEYARMLEVHEKMGHVQIPKINVDIPMYAGTSEEVLQKGIGHLEGTSLPVGGNSTHSVLTAHRGLPNARLFSELDQLVVGDKFYIHYIGGTLAYQVDQILVIEPTDFSELLVVPGHDYITLLTCTPYMVNSHRLIVRGHQVDYVPEVEERLIAENQAAYFYKYAFFATLGVLLFVLFVLFVGWIKKRRAKKKARIEEAKRLHIETRKTEITKGKMDEEKKD